MVSAKQRVSEYLRQRRSETPFFKSRYIADELGLSAKEVGAAMATLRDEANGIEIRSWGGDSDGETWYVELTSSTGE